MHALTDVTGFGLLGHLLEVCRGSGVRATVAWSGVPLLTEARELASAGFVTGGSARNWKEYASHVDLTTYGAIEQAILTDPQTSGGLLVACAPEAVDEVLEVFLRRRLRSRGSYWRHRGGPPGVSVR